MVSEDAYCIDILQQILAVDGLLKSSSEKLLDNHLRCCFASGMESAAVEKKDQLVNELVKVMHISRK